MSQHICLPWWLNGGCIKWYCYAYASQHYSLLLSRAAPLYAPTIKPPWKTHMLRHYLWSDFCSTTPPPYLCQKQSSQTIHPDTTPSKLSVPPTPSYLHFMPNALSAAILPIFSGLGQAVNNACLHIKWLGLTNSTHTHTHYVKAVCTPMQCGL